MNPRVKLWPPSPAMIVAFVALVAALSGTAVALPGRNLITSDDIRRGAVKNADIGRGAVSSTKLRNRVVTNAKLANGAVGTAKIANDAVTGEKVNEGTLGQVPSAAAAATATNAANAANAQQINGLGATKILLIDRSSGSVGEQTIYNANGLILRGSCAAGAETIVADTTVPGGEISSVGDDAGGGADFDVFDDAFNPGDNLVLSPGTPNDQVYTVNYTGGDDKFVLVRLATEGPTNATCEISGLAIGG
jgi:hypothetical protein